MKAGRRPQVSTLRRIVAVLGVGFRVAEGVAHGFDGGALHAEPDVRVHVGGGVDLRVTEITVPNDRSENAQKDFSDPAPAPIPNPI